MELFKRIWNAIKMAADVAITYIIGPFQVLTEGNPNANVMVVSTIGALARIIFVLSFFVTIPSVIMFFVTVWLSTSLRFHIFGGSLAVVGTIFTPAAEFAQAA